MDQQIIDLYDRYTHGGIDRRQFIDWVTGLVGGAAGAGAVLALLESNRAQAAVIAEADPRLVVETVTLTSEAADADQNQGVDRIAGYLAKPADGRAHPAVIVIHENRGLNPHIKDVARRFALEGFTVLAPDYLSRAGGTPADEDAARALIGKLTAAEVVVRSRQALTALTDRTDTTGRVGAVGFCWGGGMVNRLAAAEPRLAAAVAYYGPQPPIAEVAGITAPLLLHYAGLDQRINAGIADFEAALKQAGKSYQLYLYEGVNHAFNNDTSAARYDQAAADLAWARTVAFLKQYLGS